MRMEWVLHTTSEHGVSSITTDVAHTSAASSRLNWRPRQFKWSRPFRRKTKSGFCACAITFQTCCTSICHRRRARDCNCVWMSEYSNAEQSSCLIIFIIFVNLAGCLLRDSSPVYQLHITVIIVSARRVSCSEKRRCAQSDVIHRCN